MSNTMVDRVEVWCTGFPLEPPVVLGDLVIRRRDFVAVRLRTKGGLEGVAFALSRGAPTDLVISEVLGPLVVGLDIAGTDTVVERCSTALITLGTTGIALRAVSLLDIAVWDLKAKLVGVPLWRLLGGQDHEIPVMLVAPYAAVTERDQDYAERLALKLGDLRMVKLYPAADVGATARRLQAIRNVVGPAVDLVLDVAWSWKTLEEGVAAAGAWADVNLRWIEDPYPPDRFDLTRDLHNAIPVPVGAGDDVAAPWLVEALLNPRGVDVLRLDTTSIGGFTAFKPLVAQAARADCPVSPHAYAEIHQHCAAVWPGIIGVEVFPLDSPTWLADRFVRNPVTGRLRGATLAPSELPGLGLEMDWEVIATHAIRSGASTMRS